MNPKILLADDEKDIIEFLKYNLESEGFEIIPAYNGEEALNNMDKEPDLVVLDVMMPKLNGYEVCERIRKIKRFENIPVLFLTAKISELDELKGFEVGADDFIKKPISPKTLVARIKSKLRRAQIPNIKPEQESKIINSGPIYIDKEKYKVTVDGKSIAFPKKEFEILYFLITNRGKVYPRDVLLNEIWGSDVYVVDRTIDVHIRKIREKLGKYSSLIETIKGVGYRFKDVE